jgi:hypothetical protein
MIKVRMGKTMLRLNFILIIAAVFAVCKPSGERADQSEGVMKSVSGLQKAIVDSFTINDSKKEKAVDVLLAGQLPSPAYTIERVDVKRRGRVIEITPWMRYDPNKIVIMMTIPYTERVSVEDLDEKEYTIRVADEKQIRSLQVDGAHLRGIEKRP